MAIFTKTQFKRVVDEAIGFRSLRDVVNEAKNFSKGGAITTVFLSHSHKDKELVRQVVAKLRDLDAQAYVDWMDETMDETPNGITGQRVKGRIKELEKFIFIATNEAIVSKWCNWEVGIGDVLKLQQDNICLLPIADTREGWKGNEFLQVYPRVEPDPYDESELKLIYPNGRKIDFDDWLNK